VRAAPLLASWVAVLLCTGGMAKATSKKYLGNFIRFIQWYTCYGFDIMNGKGMEFADESLWLLWIAWMGKGYAYSTIKSYIFSIKNLYIIRFGFDPFKTNRVGEVVNYTRVKRALRQLKRDSCNVKRKPKFSLTKFVLLKLKGLLDFDLFDDVLLWAIVTVGVSLLLRWSEITLVHSDYDKLLHFHDLLIVKDKAIVSLRDTKTKIFGDPMSVTFFKDGTKVCPMEATNLWLDIKPDSTWLFSLKDGSPVKSIWVQSKLKTLLKKIGIQSQEWQSGISLRKGGAFTLSACGVPDRVIQVYGRWKSNAYRVYIDMTDEQKFGWSERVKRSIVKGTPMMEMNEMRMAEIMHDE